GTYDEQRVEIADVSTRLFGAEVSKESIIAETLTRETPELDFSASDTLKKLSSNVKLPVLPTDYQDFINSPIASWLEDCFGLRREEGTKRLVRAKPQSIRGNDGAGEKLASLTGESVDTC